jgi:hypothetical protein
MSEGNMFDAKIILAAKDDAKGEGKKQDVIKLNLECVGPLEQAKDSLAAVMGDLSDPDIVEMVRGFIGNISGIQEKMLSLTVERIRSDDENRFAPAVEGVEASIEKEGLDSEEDAPGFQITPGMISGKEDIPS